MAWIALACYGLYLALAFCLRSAIQLRRTGSTGFKGISGLPGSLEWSAGVLFGVALIVGALAPLLAVTGALEPVDFLDGAVGHALGLALFTVGLAGTLYAQLAMGESWRVGVDESERTDLVMHGPFAVVRNPIFAAMIPTSLGLTLMVPNEVALIGFAVLVLALEIQVRLVEEPYLRQVHGDAYASYASRTGRFAPNLGRSGAGLASTTSEREGAKSE
jgi:protein-S-isoprenylcysteine O-methyltransferase Ste14